MIVSIQSQTYKKVCKCDAPQPIVGVQTIFCVNQPVCGITRAECVRKKSFGGPAMTRVVCKNLVLMNCAIKRLNVFRKKTVLKQYLSCVMRK